MRQRTPVSALAGALAFVVLASATGQSRPQAKSPSPAELDAVQATQLFRAGSEAFAAGDLRTAHNDFSRLVHLAPRVSAAHAALGAVLLAESHPAEAAAELTEAHRLDPADSASTINLAVAQSRLGNDAAALALFRSLAPDTLNRMQSAETLAFAGALAHSGDLAGAEAVLQRAVSGSAGTNPEMLDALGSVQAQQTRYEPARQSFTQALAANQNYPSAHAHLGSLLLLTGHAAEAVDELRHAQRLGDASPVTAVELGRALSASGGDREAVTVLRAALRSQPDSLDARYALALALQAAGQAQDALPFFAEVVKGRPRDAGALTNYGLALVQTGDARGGLAQYNRAASLDPQNSTLHEDMGVAYLQTNDIDHAIEQFKTGLGIDPDNPQLHYDLGLGYKLKDNLADAVLELERAEALDPKLPDPPYTLGVIRMQQGNAGEAVHQLQQAVALRPDNADAWALLGSEQKDAGNLDAAADALHHAIALAPEQPSPHITLAGILAAKGDRQAASTERKAAADLSRSAMSRQRAGFALQSGRALLAKGDLPGAILQLNDAVAAEPNLKEAHLLLAEAFQKQGRFDQALAERQKAQASLEPSP